VLHAVRWETQAPVVASDPNRTDIACFVGFVRRRRGADLPPTVRRWLDERGWTRPPYERRAREVNALLDVPVPIDSWDVFDHLFEWERRDLDLRGTRGTSYMGAAVRSFFAQGGRRCYVVRLGDPWRYDVTRAWRTARLQRIVPGFRVAEDASPADPRSWRGVAHLFGLPDVSFLCLPDVADAVRTEPVAMDRLLPPMPEEEQWVECSEGERASGPDGFAPPVRAPRADERGFRTWAELVHLAAEVLARWRRDVQLVVALPLIPEGLSVRQRSTHFVAHDDLLRFLVLGGWLGEDFAARASVASAFVQLAYPWLRTPGSQRLPEGVEPPDGVLVGMLARNALGRGTFRSAAGLDAGDAFDVFPAVRRDQMEREVEAVPGPRTPARTPPRALPERVSLFGPTPAGIRLLSDVTATPREGYRLAAVNRMVGAILRAARRLGEESVFEASGEAVWLRIEDGLRDLMLGLLRLGALRGASTDEAFAVRCDRTTMSQNDLDSGRIVALVEFQSSVPIERITVVLALDDGGHVSLARPEAA
jgi:uncharacterized protein